MNEIEGLGTRPNLCSQVFARWNQEVKSSRMGFKYFSSGWILMVPKHSLLKYFTLSFTRHKSSKLEGSGPPLIWEGELRLLFVKCQGCGSNSEVLIRPSNSDSSAQLWKRVGGSRVMWKNILLRDPSRSAFDSHVHAHARTHLPTHRNTPDLTHTHTYAKVPNRTKQSKRSGDLTPRCWFVRVILISFSFFLKVWWEIGWGGRGGGGRVPGLGQITWWIVLTKKLRGHPGKKLAQKSWNSCIVNGRGCGCIGTVDSWRTFLQS